MALTKVQEQERSLIKTYIARETRFDAETVVFHGDGTVSAVEDADKTFNGPHTDRLVVGGYDELFKQASA